MKKILIFTFAVMLMFSIALVMAIENGNAAGQGTQTNTETQQQNQGEEDQIQNTIQVQNSIKAGNYSIGNGKLVLIQEQLNNKWIIKSGNVSADCDCNMTQEQAQNRTRLYVNLSNGRNAEIKVMPDVASETALNRLRLKVCNEANNCTIVLKEVGQGNDTKLAYEFQVERYMRILAMFKTKAQAKTQINAETGEVIGVKNPWWAFLATKQD